MLSANDIFYVSALAFLALIVLVWFARPGARQDGCGRRRCGGRRSLRQRI